MRLRCGSSPRLPTAHVLPAPAGVTLRTARRISLSSSMPLAAGPRGWHGTVSVHVRLRFVPERLALTGSAGVVAALVP
jgi:hypothetical protein